MYAYFPIKFSGSGVDVSHLKSECDALILTILENFHANFEEYTERLDDIYFYKKLDACEIYINMQNFYIIINWNDDGSELHLCGGI